jgi:hypothetical protein
MQNRPGFGQNGLLSYYGSRSMRGPIVKLGRRQRVSSLARSSSRQQLPEVEHWL